MFVEGRMAYREMQMEERERREQERLREFKQNPPLVPEEQSAVYYLQGKFGTRFSFVDGKRGHLNEVSLSQAELSAIPDELYSFKQITRLTLSNNHLTEIPSGLIVFSNLASLDISNNRLVTIAAELERLPHLDQLRLSGNQLTEIPPKLGHAQQLTQLHLDGNDLTALPPELGQLKRLTHLVLSRNRLTALPPELARLKNLTELQLVDNPLPDPYAELNARGTSAVLAYLRSLADSARVVPLREARLILVGSGKVGKTQLKNALLGLPFEEQAPSTHGVEIDRTQLLRLPVQHGDDLSLTIWDFGGQETYEVTHQFFYGKRSVYLLVWHPRALSPDLGVEAWLRKLQLRLGRQARVIIVATHKDTDHRPPDLDLNALRQKFGEMVLGFYQVENKSRDETTNGIRELKAELATAAAKLSQIGMQVNRDWLAVRDELTTLAEKETHIPRSRFDEIASRHGLTDVAMIWLTLLHDLGYLLYYGQAEGLEKIVVLRPDWLTVAIACALDDPVILDQQGVLHHARLADLWERYDAALHPFLHAVMEQFDICCRDKSESWSLMGEKVPHNRPNELPPSNGHQLRMVYGFDDDPPGLIPWLIVRSYRFTVNKHWRLGAYLQHDGHTALIEFDPKKRQLILTVNGPVPVNFFALLQDGVEQVLPRWEGLKDNVRRLVPCGQVRKDGTLCEEFFLLRHLKTAAAGNLTLQCHECLRPGNPARLLAGMGLIQEPIVEQVEALLDLKLPEHLEPLRHEFQHGQRRLLRAVTGEGKNAPRLFSMWSLRKSFWERVSPTKIGTYKCEIWLWCEHLELPHPVKRYEHWLTSDWLKKIAPYVKLIATMLKAGLPVLGHGLDEYLKHIGTNKDDRKELKERIDLMKDIAESFASDERITARDRVAMTDGLTVAEGKALREFHGLLKELDKFDDWGDLRSTLTREGDCLWLCPEHHELFNPGLIELPTVRGGSTDPEV